MKVYAVKYPTGRVYYRAHADNGTFFDAAPSLHKLRKVHGAESFAGIRPEQVTLEEYRRRSSTA